MKSETRKTNILTKKHTVGPDSQNCSREVSPHTGRPECGKKPALPQRNYGASERQRKTTEEETAARTHALTHAHAHKHQPPAHPRAHDTRHRQERRCYPSPPHKARAADANRRRRPQGRTKGAHAPTTRALTRARHTAQAGAPVLPLAASQGEGGRRQPPPPSTGPRQERGARACPRQPPRSTPHPHSTHPPTTHLRRENGVRGVGGGRSGGK